MIPLSGALVLLAAGLLVDGVFFTGSGGVPWQVVAAVVASVAAFAVIVASAVRQRDRLPSADRPTELADGAPGPAPRPVTAPASPAPPLSRPAVPTAGPSARPPADPPVNPPAHPAAAPGPRPPEPATAVDHVRVVPGLAHYHLDGCDRLAATGSLPLTLEEASSAGYRPCPRCQPPAPTSVDGIAGRQPRAGDVTDPTVVVVRGYFHRPDCRYVAVAEQRTEQLRSAARAAGALPCGVCLP